VTDKNYWGEAANRTDIGSPGKLANSWQMAFLNSSPATCKTENDRINTGDLFMVGLGGLELPTAPLSVLRSLVLRLEIQDL
jgi:hypothetical protein